MKEVSSLTHVIASMSKLVSFIFALIITIMFFKYYFLFLFFQDILSPTTECRPHLHDLG